MKELSILSVSPAAEDHSRLKAILGRGLTPRGKWKFYGRRTLERAAALLRAQPVSVVVCERDSRPGDWKEMLESWAAMLNPPLLIVTSRLADERLWAEVLNLGGWDVLAKPFEAGEVVRAVGTAWRQWENRRESMARNHTVRTATR